MTDLCRLPGIGSKYAELLKMSGVYTVKELRNRNSENLYAKMVEMKSGVRKLVRLLPGLKRVQLFYLFKIWIISTSSLSEHV